MIYDCLIIGGGASGLAAAIRLKQNDKNLKVCILEKLSRVGKKLAITGNGRCNISNEFIELSRYHGQDTRFAEYSLNRYSSFETEEFFDKIGVPFISEENKLFPACLQASSVVDALRFECDNLGIETVTDANVTDISLNNYSYNVSSSKGDFSCKNLIVASGLLSGGDKVGSDGSILRLLSNKGFKTVPTSPAIVQLKTETELVKQLKGIKVNATATLKINREKIRSEFGEVLFTDYGVSGPAIMQISREAARAKSNDIKVCLDLMPGTPFGELYNSLILRKKRLSYRSADEFFTGLLNKRLGQVLLKASGIKLNGSAAEIDEKHLKTVVSNIKCFELKVTGSTGYINSQVTAGGLDTNEFFSNSMMSKKHKGLFAIGEILDIDGDCGGFNLAWAFSSAFCAADYITGEE